MLHLRLEWHNSRKELPGFAEKEFEALRQEISELQTRRFQSMALGTVAAPTIFGFGDAEHVSLIIYLLPVLVVGLVLLETSQHEAIYRAGTYIRKHIEKSIGNGLGWEHWLNHFDSRRSADKYISFAFFIIFSVYYIGFAGYALSTLYIAFKDGLWWMDHPFFALMLLMCAFSLYLLAYAGATLFYSRSCKHLATHWRRARRCSERYGTP